MESNTNSKTEEIRTYTNDKQYRIRLLMVFVADILSVFASYLIALWLRYDFRISTIPDKYLYGAVVFSVIAFIVDFIIYCFNHLYLSIWRYASITEAWEIVKAYFEIFVLMLLALILIPGRIIPSSVFCMGIVFNAVGCCIIRFGYRIVRYLIHQRDRDKNHKKNVMIVGAGQAGKELINDLRLGEHPEYKVCCIIDDNPNKKGRYLESIKIIGGRHLIPSAVEKYGIDLIILAMPSATHTQIKSIVEVCQSTDAKIQTVPGMFQLMSGKVRVTQLRDVNIGDLLGRDEVNVNLDEIKASIHGKVVMVTGGGGSIGSELCRQIASSDPKQLIIFDIYENNAFAIQQELKRAYPTLNLVTLIGSVRNISRVNSVLKKYRPELVYHAAAHKHVPLMEDSPCEAIKNNVMGTYNMASASAKYGVKRFLLISTDKAVNPTSLMGASKRLCEMVIQMMSRKYPSTIYMAVRFGNVLGSNGSVIPTFKKQIAEGGPVTVTDKNIIRYFMTIPEAVSLVLQASYYAKGGEIFILDMGDPVRIDDMARNLIKLSGYTPDKDIKIVYTGLRPGEKLYEELLMDEEGKQTTPNKLIYIGKPIEMDDSDFMNNLRRLNETSKSEANVFDMKNLVSEIVPTYQPDLKDNQPAVQ